MPFAIKALALAGSLPFLVSATEPTPSPQFVHYASVEQVLCDTGRGTAFRISPTTFLSVNHVTRMTGCSIAGKPYTLAYASPEQDFSILTVQYGGTAAKVNCGGFIPGEWYYAVGNALGLSIQTLVTLKAVGVENDGRKFSVMMASYTVIPGMSGGPIFNAAGEVVGTVNAYNGGFKTSYSRSLADTKVCK
jgi:hypothetical protein